MKKLLIILFFLGTFVIVPHLAFAIDLYWVGGTGTWNATVGTKWALTSGGIGGVPVPTAADNVFFDGNSGSGTVTISASSVCLSFNSTNFAGTIAGSNALPVSGSLTIGNSGTWSYTGSLNLIATSAQTVQTNGVVLTNAFSFNGVAGVWTLQDALTTSGAITLTRGTFDVGGFDVSAGSFSSSAVTTRVFTLTNRTLSLTGPGTIWNTGTSSLLTFNKTGSTVKVPTIAGVTARTITTGGLAFNNLWLTGTNSGTITFSSANTFADFKDDNTSAHTLLFTAGTTTTVSTLNIVGTGNLKTLASVTPGSAWTLSSASGTRQVDFTSIQDSTASGGATFNAYHSLNISGNTGWSFKPQQGESFFAFF